jgi:hypothetical protein
MTYYNKSSKMLSRKHSHFTRLAAAGLVIMLAVALGWYMLYHHFSTNSTTTKGEATSASSTQKSAGAPAASNTLNETRKGSTSPLQTLTTTPPSSTSSISVEIVNANINNGNLHVGTLVNGTTNGTCTLTASQSGQPELQLGTSSVHQNVNNYDCGVFNVSTSSFPHSGNWQLTLSVSSGDSQASGNHTVIIPGNG